MSYAALLKNRDFRALLASQSFSKIGDMLTGIALPLLIFERTGSAMSMAFMMAAYWLPPILFAPFFGLYVDRVDRKRLMVITDIVRLVLTVLIPLMPSMPLLYALCFVIASTGRLFDLAKVGLTVQVVERDQLLTASSLVQSLDNLFTILGPILAGAAIAALGFEWPFYLDGLTFLISGLLLLRVRIPPLERSTVREPLREKMRRDFREGTAHIKKTPALLFSMTLFPFVMMFAMPTNVLFYPLFQGELGADSRMIGLAVSLFGIFTILGSLVSPRLNRQFNRIYLMQTGLFLFGVSSVGLALSDDLIAALCFYAAGAFFNGFVNPLNQALRQENTPVELMGRVTGMYGSLVTSLSMVTMLAAGVLGDQLGARTLYLYASIGYGATALLAFLSPWYRSVRDQYRIPPAADPAQEKSPASL